VNRKVLSFKDDEEEAVAYRMCSCEYLGSPVVPLMSIMTFLQVSCGSSRSDKARSVENRSFRTSVARVTSHMPNRTEFTPNKHTQNLSGRVHSHSGHFVFSEIE